MRHVAEMQSRYGYTWRDIRRPYDRELGIAGGETAVVDLRTNEIIGLRRGFVLGNRLATGGMWWLTGTLCPRYSQFDKVGKYRKRDKDGDYKRLFVTKVAVPNAVWMSFEDYDRMVQERQKARDKQLDEERPLRQQQRQAK